MTNPESQGQEPTAALRWEKWARNGAFWSLIAILAWAPFPLGSNREWSWGLLSMLVSGCWMLWVLSSWTKLAAQWRKLKHLRIPLALASITVTWAIVQALPITPVGWVHPVWAQAGNLLKSPLKGTISLNPWQTFGELTKLATYVAIGLLAFMLAHNSDRARQFLNAVIAIGAIYAAYAFMLHMAHIEQFRLFYKLPFSDAYLSGPFVQRNNFATYEGLISLAALVKLVSIAYQELIGVRGRKRIFIKSTRFLLGGKTPIVIATILAISALCGTGSRGGFLATVAGLTFLAVGAALTMKRRIGLREFVLAGCAMVCLLLPLIIMSGALLTQRMQALLNAGTPDPVRVVLWNAAERMIQSAPMLGLGLGTFSDAYPLYATGTLPYIMDRAHNDFLEFAAGLGIPAAICWWAAWAVLLARLIHGASIRRRSKMYAFIGAGATILVVAHSLVDFSLQIPAVSITYAALLGIGLAQSIPHQNRTSGEA